MSQTLQIKINDEYLDLVPRLLREERQHLKESMILEGQHNPITVNQDGVILDGHTRFEICQELNVEPKITRMVFTNKHDEMNYVVSSNLIRRQLSPFQRVELFYKLYRLQKHQGQKRKGSNSEVGRTREIIGKTVGLSGKQVYNAVYLLENADEKTLGLLRKNTLSIHQAYQKIRNKTGFRSKPRKNLTVQALLDHFKNDIMIKEQLTKILERYERELRVTK